MGSDWARRKGVIGRLEEVKSSPKLTLKYTYRQPFCLQKWGVKSADIYNYVKLVIGILQYLTAEVRIAILYIMLKISTQKTKYKYIQRELNVLKSGCHLS